MIGRAVVTAPKEDSCILLAKSLQEDTYQLDRCVMSIFQATFSAGQIVAATGVSNINLQAWIRRGVLIGANGEQIDMPGRPGIRRAFSFFTLMEIAVAKALMDIGIELATALRVAQVYAHTDSALIVDGSRLPGLPFRERFTVLCMNGEGVDIARWVPKSKTNGGDRILATIGKGGVVLIIEPIFERVMDALGYTASKALAEAYHG